MVGFHGRDVRPRRLFVAPDAQIDVRRHVHDVTGAGHQPRQPLRAWQRPLGAGGGLDRVDVEVAAAGMVRLAREQPLERRDELLAYPAAAGRRASTGSTGAG